MMWKRLACLEKRVIKNSQQMVSMDLQFAQEPFFLQGMSNGNRCALAGAAILRARERAASTSFATLFIPTIIRTWEGP